MVLDFGLLNSGLFDTSVASGEGFGADVNTVVWNDVGIGIVPIGSIIPWCKTLAGCPPLLPSFVQCDGQVLDDPDSPFDGETIPDLNGNNNFLRGDSTSGSTGGAATHNHKWYNFDNGNNIWDLGIETIDVGADCESFNSSGTATVIDSDLNEDWYTDKVSTLPPYYTVVWIMRVK